MLVKMLQGIRTQIVDTERVPKNDDIKEFKFLQCITREYFADILYIHQVHHII